MISEFFLPPNVLNINEAPAYSKTLSESTNQGYSQDFRNAEIVSLEYQILFDFLHV